MYPTSRLKLRRYEEVDCKWLDLPCGGVPLGSFATNKDIPSSLCVTPIKTYLYFLQSKHTLSSEVLVWSHTALHYNIHCTELYH